MWYKLTWMYIGQDKIRPSGWGWWQPWADTIAYYPLTTASTVNDESWNSHTMSQYWGTFWTYWWVDCLSLSSSNYLSCTISQLPQWNNPITISCWCWINDISWEQWIFWYGRNGRHRSFQFAYHTDYFWVRTYQDDCVISSYSSYTWKWIYITWTSDWSSVKFYINWQLQQTASHSQDMQDTTLYIWKWIVNYWMTWYISNCIVENVAWTQQEISDYYDITKAKYWIS